MHHLRALLRTHRTVIIAGAVYLTLLAWATHGLLPVRTQFAFVLYGLVLFAIVRQEAARRRGPRPPRREERFFTILTVLSFGGILLARLLPFLRFGASPLGYDTGFYWQIYNLIIPGGTIVNAVGASATGSHLAFTPWFPLAALGLDALTTIHALHVFHQLLTAGALYILIRAIAPPKIARAAAACSVFLFAVSMSQFFAYWWMFYKQSFALPFFLLALALFFRKSWLAIPIAAFAAAIHLPTAIPLGAGFAITVLLTLVVALVRTRRVPRDIGLLVLGGAIALGAVVLIKGTNDLAYYWGLLMKYRGLATSAHAWEVEQIKGLFIPFSTFRLATLYAIPFALLGATMLRLRRARAKVPLERPVILLATAAVLLVLVSFPFMHQHRSLILLDVILITFAATPLASFVQYGLRGALERMTLGLLLAGLTFSITFMVWHQRPQLYTDEAAELARVRFTGTAATGVRGVDDYVMTTSSLYTPWVYSYTGFGPTIVPGWLTWDKWDLSQWNTFWSDADDAKRLDLLRMYGDHTIYIFIGRHVLEQSPDSPLHTFIRTDPHFTPFSPHIWKYTPVDSIPDAYGS